MIQALLNPPFNRTFAELGGLTDSQIVFLYDVGERGEGGVPKLKPPSSPAPSLGELFVRKCFLLGITDPDTVARLWKAERARLEKLNPKRRGRKG